MTWGVSHNIKMSATLVVNRYIELKDSLIDLKEEIEEL